MNIVYRYGAVSGAFSLFGAARGLQRRCPHMLVTGCDYQVLLYGTQRLAYIIVVYTGITILHNLTLEGPSRDERGSKGILNPYIWHAPIFR